MKYESSIDIVFKVETILKEREQSTERQRRLADKTAGLRRTIRL